MSGATKVKPIGGAKNGKERVLSVVKAARRYELEPVSRPLRNRKNAKPTKLRASITPGTVLILLAGRFRGKRVVFLKQLPSGLLLVSGPHKINGVPLKRVNQAYVIATSTKVDISGVKLHERLSDALFKKKTDKESEKKEFFEEASSKTKELSSERKALQTELDLQMLPLIKKTPLLKSYLRSHFTLKKGQAPHMMKF